MPAPALLVLLGVFLLSNIAFLFRAAASPWIAVAGATALIGAAVYLFRGVRQAPLGRGWTLGIAALALLVCVVGGSGHLMFTSEDWTIRDAVLHDMAGQGWPVVYHEGGADHVLRAPLGFYMLPSLVGRWLGPLAMQAAVLAQNAALLAAVLLLLLREARTTRSRLIVAAVFLLFSGVDAGAALLIAISSVAHHVPIDLGLHIDHLNGLEYSSVVTDLFWAPNHGLPAFAFAAVYLCWRRGECSAAAAAFLGGLCLLWSPLAVMGAAPFALYALISDLRERRLTLGQIVAGAATLAAVAPALIFLQLDGGHVVHNWMTQEAGFPRQYALFFAFDILPLLCLLACSLQGERLATKPEVVLIVLMLTLIPLYRIGMANDFVMRASVVAITLTAVITGRRVAELAAGGQWREARPMIILLALGAITPALEITRAVIHPASPPVALPLPEAWRRSPFDYQPRDTYFASPESLARFWPMLKPAPAAPPTLARAAP